MSFLEARCHANVTLEKHSTTIDFGCGELIVSFNTYSSEGQVGAQLHPCAKREMLSWETTAYHQLGAYS